MKRVLKMLLIMMIAVGIIYIFLWLASIKKQPIDYGMSFSPGHAEYLGLDWKETYTAMLTDLNPMYLRLNAAWNMIEVEQDNYDFTDIDWMMQKAQENGTKVTLVIGQKAPRWPECFIPDWANGLEDTIYKQKLFNYIITTVNRYKDNEALELWQIENEPFIKFKFGECGHFRENLVNEEIDLVKQLDSVHWTMVTDSGEMSTWWQASRSDADIFGSTLYRIVRTPGGIIWRYDWLPAAFYRYKAMLLGIHLEQFYISELQAEPWFNDIGPLDTPLDIQEKTMNPERLKKHLDIAHQVGARRAYLWGVEWWYYMKTVQQKSDYWNIIKGTL